MGVEEVAEAADKGLKVGAQAYQGVEGVEVRHRVAFEGMLYFCLLSLCPVDPGQSAQPCLLSFAGRPLHDDRPSSCLLRTSAAA